MILSKVLPGSASGPLWVRRSQARALSRRDSERLDSAAWSRSPEADSVRVRAPGRRRPRGPPAGGGSGWH